MRNYGPPSYLHDPVGYDTYYAGQSATGMLLLAGVLGLLCFAFFGVPGLWAIGVLIGSAMISG